jgi:hypothetical protein
MFLFASISLPDILKSSIVVLKCEFYTHKATEYTVSCFVATENETLKAKLTRSGKVSGIYGVASVNPSVTSLYMKWCMSIRP